MNRDRVFLLLFFLLTLLHGHSAQLFRKRPKILDKLIVQPGDTITDDSKSEAAPRPADPSAAQKLAQEIRSKGSASGDSTLKEIRQGIIKQNGGNSADESVRAVLESDLLNAFHEAIDEKIVDQSFIQTLAAVEEPPLINDYTRDTLLINSIKEDASFDFGENVFAWKTLDNGAEHVIVGLSNESLFIVHEYFGEYVLRQEVPMETVPTAFEVATVWDRKEDSAVNCLLVATELSLVWYSMRASNNFSLTEEWRWPLYKMTTLIKCFQYRDVQMVLLIGTHPNKQRSVSATLYEFNYELHQFWLMQKLALQFPCRTVGLVNVDREFLVVLPQNNTAMIYSLEAREQYRGRFTLIANITSEQLKSVEAFQIGRYAYIAIGGRSPQILRYANGNFSSQALPTEQLETVEAFFEIPTSTYRDDLILLVQHRMSFSTHDLQRLDALVWNGESFDRRSNIPCYVEDVLVDYEVSCVLDLHRPNGIMGSTIFQRGKQVSMIVPRHKAHSSLFHINITMLSAEHPVIQKVQEIRDTIDAFSKIIAYQDAVIIQAIGILNAASGLEQPVMTIENCKLARVQANVAYLEPGLRWPGDQIMVGNVSWTPEDLTIDVPAIALEIEYEMGRLAQLERKLQYAVRKDNDSFSLELHEPLVVHGQLEIGGKLVTDDLLVRRMEENPYRSRVPREIVSYKELHLKNLKVDQLHFETVNGVPASDLVFNTGDKIELGGKLIVEGTLVANNVVLPPGGTVGGIDLSESTVYFNCKNRRWRNLTFDQLEVVEDALVQDTVNGVSLDWNLTESKLRAASEERRDVLEVDKLILDGNLYAEYVNGVRWSEFIQQIVLKNRPNRLRELHIDGNLVLSHPNTTVYHLNGYAFPDDYLLSNSPREAIVTGQKFFLNKTYVETVDVDTTVCGINLTDIITLHDDQYIPGNVTFDELHVTERLEVRGAVHGKYMNRFLDNPTLLETKHVKAACHFNQLHIDGPIVVRKTLNGMDVDATLADVVYDTETNVVINAEKYFESVEFLGQVNITSGMINDVRLDHFMTRSTDQVLEMDELNGDIFFERLTLDGLFDGINVTELDRETIKLFGDQYTEATLVFQNRGSQYPEIEANELRIVNKLNSKKRSEYVDIGGSDEELVFSGVEVVMGPTSVGNLELVGSPVDGPTKMINDVHLPTFEERRFSLTRPQHVQGSFYVDKLVVGRSIGADFVNGVDLRGLRMDLDRMENLKAHLLAGDIPIENLYIEGDLQVNMLNDVNFDALLKEVIWLNRPNHISGTMHFLDTLKVSENMTTKGPVNGVDFEEFLGDLVYKTDEVAEFYANKIFTNGLVVEGDVETESINNLRIQDLALKNQTIYLRGNVQVVGHLAVNHLVVEGNLNDVPIQDYLSVYRYDEDRNVHVINADVHLDQCSIDHWAVKGALNHIPNVDAYLASLIRKDQDYNFTRPMRFMSDVIFEKGFQVDYVNDIDVRDIKNQIIRIDGTEPVELTGDIVFTAPVHFEELIIEGDMVAPNVGGINPDEWAANGIMINKDAEIYSSLTFEPGTADIEHLQVDVLNGFPADKIITLNTDQTITGSMYFDEMVIDQPLEVGGLVNGVYFPYERQNTLMTYGVQHIRMPTVFNNIKVLESLTLPPVLNGVPFGTPVVLGPKMTIESPISFHHLVADSLETQDMISGIDFDDWYENSLWTSGRDHQTIDAKIVAKEVHFGAPVTGNGMINGIDIKEVVRRLKDAKKNVEIELQDHRASLRSLCSSAQDLVSRSRERLFFFKYFVQRQTINEHLAIDSFHFFDHLEYHFLAVSMGCDSHFYQWDPVGREFVPRFTFHTGVVEEWATVVDGDRAVYLVTRSPNEVNDCKTVGVSVWMYTGVELRLVWNVADASWVQSVQGDSHKPDSFYVLQANQIVEYGIDGVVYEQWVLPQTEHGYRIVPSEARLGLAASDGKLLVLLSSVNRTEPRVKRHNDDVQMALFSAQSMYEKFRRNSTTVQGINHENSEPSEVVEPGYLRVNSGDDQDSNGTIILVNDLPVESLPFSTDSEEPHPEPPIPKEIPLGGMLVTENPNFPKSPDGELLTFEAGFYGEKRHLVAVSGTVDAVIKGDHDSIKIYEDIQAGKLYQVIPCHRPSQLSALELRDETILAFLEERRTVRLYIYRGVQGFVSLNSFRLKSAAVQMRAVALPQAALHRCKLHYLAVATQQHELVLFKAQTQGDCGLTVDVDCEMD